MEELSPRSEIHELAEAGNIQGVKRLLDSKSSINASRSANNRKNQTVLQAAAFANQVDMIKLLISRKADVNFVPAPDWAALHWACCGKAEAAVACLLANKANVNQIGDSFRRDTPLMLAF